MCIYTHTHTHTLVAVLHIISSFLAGDGVVHPPPGREMMVGRDSYGKSVAMQHTDNTITVS